MRRWELLSELQAVRPFDSPDAALEQYATAPDITASTLDAVHHDGAVSDALIADFGCGTGRLSVAAALHNAAFVIAADIDADSALNAARNNIADDYPCIDLVRADVAASDFLRPGAVDTVIMNPPFGTKRQGVDMAFLARAARAAQAMVYSMHKSSTRDYIARKLPTWNAQGRVIAEVRFDIGRTLRFHKNHSVDVAVDVWRVDVSEVDAGAVQPVEPVGELMNSCDIGPSRGRNQRRGRARRRGRY